MNEDRIKIIDFFRGIIICDMILVHFSGYFTVQVAKALSYTDIAMEGFVLLAGFMVGWRYYPAYLVNRSRIVKKLFRRAFQILLVQYLLIFTINLPLYYFFLDTIRMRESIFMFLGKSMLFINQIGLIHILPTFIPLFLAGPVFLYAFSRNYGALVLAISILLFCIGNKYPHALDIGEKTIFPVILWQIYFVIGCLFGIKAYSNNTITPNAIDRYVYSAVILFSVAMFIKHAKVIPPSLTTKFPLNALGLLYGSSILFLVYAITMKYWPKLMKMEAFFHYLPLFGRHSLLVFIIHVYISKSLLVFNHFYTLDSYMNYTIIFLGFIATYKIIAGYERRTRGALSHLASA